MTDGLLEYSGLAAKIRAMRSQLLSRKALIKMAESETVDDFVSALRETGKYTSVYESHTRLHHRGQVEAQIGDSLYADYRRIYRFAGARAKSALEIFFFRYEVNLLKSCLEHVYQGVDNRRPSHLRYLPAAYCSFDMAAAAQANTIAQLVQVLAGTRYEAMMKRFAETKAMLCADCMTQLDIFYYETAWRLGKKLSDRRTREIVLGILGTEIDWQNIMWMYRSKQFYQESKDETARRLIPIVYRLKREEKRRLLEQESIDRFVEILADTAYFKEKDAVVKLGDEITYGQIMEKTFQALCRRYPMSIAPVLCYFYDKEREIDMLTSILECVRYRIPAREIQELVFPTAQGTA